MGGDDKNRPKRRASHVVWAIGIFLNFFFVFFIYPLMVFVLFRVYLHSNSTGEGLDGWHKQ